MNFATKDRAGLAARQLAESLLFIVIIFGFMFMSWGWRVNNVKHHVVDHRLDAIEKQIGQQVEIQKEASDQRRIMIESHQTLRQQNASQIIDLLKIRTDIEEIKRSIVKK